MDQDSAPAKAAEAEIEGRGRDISSHQLSVSHESISEGAISRSVGAYNMFTYEERVNGRC
jgi:hypothetical protein